MLAIRLYQKSSNNQTISYDIPVYLLKIVQSDTKNSSHLIHSDQKLTQLFNQPLSQRRDFLATIHLAGFTGFPLYRISKYSAGFPLRPLFPASAIN